MNLFRFLTGDTRETSKLVAAVTNLSLGAPSFAAPKNLNRSGNTTRAKNDTCTQISALLCEAYDRLFASGEVQFPLHERQQAAIDTVVKTVKASYFGYVRFLHH
jgi:hypothetical protein